MRTNHSMPARCCNFYNLLDTAAVREGNADRKKLFILADCTPLFGEFYMLFLQISKHTAESCPMHNEKVRKISIDAANKMDKLIKKYGIKVVGSWTSIPDHTNISVYDAPSSEALLKCSMEPEIIAWMGYTMTETKPIMTLEDTMKLMK